MGHVVKTTRHPISLSAKKLFFKGKMQARTVLQNQYYYTIDYTWTKTGLKLELHFNRTVLNVD